MRTLWPVSAFLVLAAACGDDGSTTMTAPAEVTVTGTATVRSTSSGPLANVTIAAYRNGNDTTPLAMTTSNGAGNYALVIPTGGQALDGYLKATLTSYMDTYLYPPAIVDADLDGASVNMITPGTFDLLANTLCNSGQETSMGAIAVVVIDAAEMPVMGATTASSPAASKVCYNATGAAGTIPSRNATATDADGVAYMFNVTGQATVSAMKSGSTFLSHEVNARAGAFTTTLIQP